MVNFITPAKMDTRLPLEGVRRRRCGGRGRPNLSSGGCPAAGDLTARYEDVRTRLDGLSIVHSFREISL